MKLDEFIQQINDAIPAPLRKEINLSPTFTASETLAYVSSYCTPLYDVLGQRLPEWLLDTFEHEQLLAHNLNINAVNLAGSYDPSQIQHFLYTIPIRTLFDKDIRVCQYGNANITVSRGTVSIYNNENHVLIQTGANVELYGHTQATVDGKAIVEAHENTYLTVTDNALVKASGNCYLSVSADATLEATDCVNIEIKGGSPIVIATKNVRIANTVKPEAKQHVRLVIDENVLVVNHPDNGTILSHTAYGSTPHIWIVEAYNPTMQRFIENMRARYASGCKAIDWSDNLGKNPAIQQSKHALLDLTRPMPQTEATVQLKKGLSQATTHQELLNSMKPHMDLLVQYGLNRKFLNDYFTYIDLTRSGIYTYADYLHHCKSSQQEIYLFGQENYPITENPDVRVHAYEHTAVLGKQANVDLHDHSMALMPHYGEVQLSGHSLAGGISAKQLIMTGQSYALFNDLGLVDLADESLLVSCHYIDIVSLRDKAQAYSDNPPSRINNHSEQTQLHYLRQENLPIVRGPLTGITPHDDAEAIKTLLKNLDKQTPGQSRGKKRGH